MAQFLHELIEDPAEITAPEKAITGGGKICVSIIGPANSTSLKAMLDDPLVTPGGIDSLGKRSGLERQDLGLGDKWNVSGLSRLLASLRWFAPRLTAPNNFLLPKGSPTTGRDLLWLASGARASDGEAFDNNDSLALRLTRTNCTDDELMTTLVDELALRGVDLTDFADHVALVTELDTFYGRAMPVSFQAAAAAKWGPSAPKQVRVFQYVRRLDGITSDGSAPESATWNAAAHASNTAPGRGEKPEVSKLPTGQGERPDGNRQYDYMRRIAQTLEDQERSFSYDHRGGFRAIGVLGSDVYDKLLVMRALHDRFPRAVFFTTDLDNRLFQKDELESTQNLIVASGYGLMLRENLQGTIPPFRDGYQTAVYGSCLEALQFVDPSSTSNAHFQSRPKPRLFEIGRDGYYDLSAQSSDGVHPAPPKPMEWKEFRPAALWIGPMILLGSLLVVPASVRLRRLIRALPLEDAKSRGLGRDGRSDDHAAVIGGLRRCERSDTTSEFWVWAGFLALSTLLFYLIRVFLVDGKPYLAVSGISLWPTEYLRLTATFLAVLFIYRASYAIRYNNIEMAMAYGLPKPQAATARPSDPSPPPSYRRLDLRRWPYLRRLLEVTICNWDNACARFRQDERLLADSDRVGRGSVPKLWLEYMTLDRRHNRMWRIVPLTVAFSVLAGLATWYWGPPLRPYRGPFSNYVDFVAMAISFFTVVLVTFYVVTQFVCARSSAIISPDARRLGIRIRRRRLPVTVKWKRKTSRNGSTSISSLRAPRQSVDSFFTRLSCWP
ncbi:MAG TPA: hypothetical protein VG269_04055 [Tepidisphaeraceae bacterium]|jgi:hypothetical protein|nr:hypothetical protein [Tepidisphaeraceae bacterium]